MYVIKYLSFFLFCRSSHSIGFNLSAIWGTLCNLIPVILNLRTDVQDKMSSKISINMSVLAPFIFIFQFISMETYDTIHTKSYKYIWIKHRLKLISFYSHLFCFNFHKTHQIIWNHFSYNLLLLGAFSEDHIRISWN